MAVVTVLKPNSWTVFMSQPESARKPAVTCSRCNLRELCLAGGIHPDDLRRLENIVYARRSIKRGEFVFRAGDEFKAVYAIFSGFFKTVLIDCDGREQVGGFFMAGELLGLDGIGAGRHHAGAIAIEDSNVCVMPFALIEAMAQEIPALQRRLHAVLAREITRDHGVMMLLGSMRAEERLATFLLNLSKRHLRRGHSACDLRLRMTRGEIGSYLGMQLETVSRLFSRFHDDGLIEADRKQVRILDVAGLEKVLARESR
jgi:CRP/FNR family transcriptional regulator